MRKYEPNIPQFATRVGVSMSIHFNLTVEQLLNRIGWLRGYAAESALGFRILTSMVVNEKNIF